MKVLIKRFYYKILTFLPTKVVAYIECFRTYKCILHLKNPKYFGEKIQWLKIYGNLERYSKYVDKLEVRNYIEKKIGKEYLIPLLHIFDNPNKINYDELPISFVFKNNNGSGMNLVVKDKNDLNISKVNKTLNKWLKSKYYKIKKENQYKNIQNLILCEKYLADKNGDLFDYKFYCIDGEPKFLKVDYNRFTSHTINFYDMQWQKIEMKEQGYENYNHKTYPPKNFDFMIEIVKELSKDFPFVRVDLYNVDGKIYFGELTFTPASGTNAFLPLEKDMEIASKIDLEKYKS